jgi:transposase
MSPTVEVEMRPPEVFVRELSPEEGNRLKSISRRARYQSKRQRAMIVLASATGMPAPQIAEVVRSDPSHVRRVIHEFNERGFDSLDPDYRGGRPRKTTPAERDRVVSIARARPDSQGVALTRWSLAKLRDHLADGGIDVSAETLRRILNEAGLSHQRTRSWKWSPDPDFAAKAERVLSLYREPLADGPVVCFDEMGPIQLITHQGAGWAPVGLPERHRASFKRPHGVRYLYGAYDVHDDRLIARLRPRKGELEMVRFLQTIRMRYDPRLRIYLVQDNLSCHWTPKVREWASLSNVELVPLPTYASYLNRIEAHFWAISEFVVNNADYDSWEQFGLAMARHISYRNGPHRNRRLADLERRKRVA